MIRLSYRSTFPVSKDALFSWHENPGAFLRLNPPFDPVTLVSSIGGIQNGARVTIKIPIIGPIGIRWNITHLGYEKNSQFEDKQVSGPFTFWHHRHLFSSLESGHSQLHDEISFGLPFGIVSEQLIGCLFRKKLSRLFRYRHRVTTSDLAVIARYKDKFLAPQKILVSGASGFIGKSLVSFLRTAGHAVYTLDRKKSSDPFSIFWNPEINIINTSELEEFDHVIHLAGEPIAQRWTENSKKKILDSRINSTKLLCDALASCNKKPKTFISASGANYYGSSQQAACDESDSKGSGFLADVVEKWENTSNPLAELGVRVCHVRTAVVLSPDGGALKKLLLPFQWGLGGPIGAGHQYMSCIGKDDLIYAYYHLLATESVSGAVNLAAPKTPTNYSFSKTLGAVLGRPAIIPIPPLVLNLMFGEMANETILGSIYIEPKKLVESGFIFQAPSVEAILKDSLGL